jgi:outer membrane lipoprotein LolB
VRRRIAAWLVTGLLAGCATAPPAVVGPPDPGGAWPDTWTVDGRLAVNVGEQGGSGAFKWQQQGDRSHLAVRGPLGVGAVDGQALTVVDSSGATTSGDAARSQVQSRLGADLPLSSLRFWVTARPDPAGQTATIRDSTKPPLRVIEQDGWHVEYDQFAEVQGHVAPTRLTATGGNVRLKLVLDRWALEAVPPAGAQ